MVSDLQEAALAKRDQSVTDFRWKPVGDFRTDRPIDEIVIYVDKKDWIAVDVAIRTNVRTRETGQPQTVTRTFSTARVTLSGMS